VKQSLPRYENEHHQSVVDSWAGILSNLWGNRLHIVINKVFAAFIGKGESEMLPAPS
jgi:hypothetical protein